MRGIKLFSCIFFFCIFNVPCVWAAADGSLSSTSTGTTVITITIPALVQISGLSDITLNPATIDTDVAGSTTACIYSNQSATPGGYVVTATSGTGGAGSFLTTDGSNNLAYTATWNDGSGAVSLTSGTTLTGQTGADQTQVDCSGGSNATFAINFAAANMQGVPQGTYTDTVTLLIEPT
jgi:hypothetical protein